MSCFSAAGSLEIVYGSTQAVLAKDSCFIASYILNNIYRLNSFDSSAVAGSQYAAVQSYWSCLVTSTVTVLLMALRTWISQFCGGGYVSSSEFETIFFG